MGSSLSFRKSFSYNYTFDIAFSKEFTWRTGNLSSYWYQVRGCCKSTFQNLPGSGCPPIRTDDAKCDDVPTTYFQTILANSVSEICQELTSSNWNWQLCSVKKWSRPAENLYVNVNDDCNVLQEVSYKDVPECLSLISNDVYFNFKFNTVVYPVALGSGTISFSGSATYGCVGCISAPFMAEDDIVFTKNDVDPTPTVSPDPTPTPTLTPTPTPIEVPPADISLVNDLVVPIPYVNSQCPGCNQIPSKLYFQNNLINLAHFSNFIYLNNKEFNSNFELVHSKLSDSWSKKFYYESSSEKWYLSFDLACVNVSLAAYYWRFAMTFKRIYSEIEYDSKLVVQIPSEFVCEYSTKFEFKFNFDVLNKYLFTNINYFGDDFVFYDKIGLFNSKYWYNNPKVVISIREEQIMDAIARKIIDY
jgi:hypothetical protein